MAEIGEEVLWEGGGERIFRALLYLALTLAICHV